MKFLLFLILVPQFAVASALVVKDDLNKIFNVIAVLNFPETGISESTASSLTYDTDLYLNNLIPEVQVAGQTWTVLFNLDYQFGYNKYPLSASCAHNEISLNKDLNFESLVRDFVSGLGSLTAMGTVEEIKNLPFAALVFEKDFTCFGAGSPLEI
jgi:hypothetical protein